MSGFVRCGTPNGIVYYVFEHKVNMESKRRTCKVCGEMLKYGESATAVLLNCEQEKEFLSPGNFLVHDRCFSAPLGVVVDQLVDEYQFVEKFVRFYGKKWRCQIEDQLEWG